MIGFYGGLRGRITMQFGRLTKRSAKIWAMQHPSTTSSRPPEARDGTLQGNDISMLSLVVSCTTREYLDDYVFGTDINFQEFLCILISWLLKHPGEVKRILHTDMFWTRRDYRGDFAHIPSYEPIYRDAFKRDCDEILDSVFRGVIPNAFKTMTAPWRC